MSLYTSEVQKSLWNLFLKCKHFAWCAYRLFVILLICFVDAIKKRSSFKRTRHSQTHALSEKWRTCENWCQFLFFYFPSETHLARFCMMKKIFMFVHKCRFSHSPQNHDIWNTRSSWISGSHLMCFSWSPLLLLRNDSVKKSCLNLSSSLQYFISS